MFDLQDFTNFDISVMEEVEAAFRMFDQNDDGNTTFSEGRSRRRNACVSNVQARQNIFVKIFLRFARATRAQMFFIL